MMPRRRIDRYAVLNFFLLLVGGFGLIVMIIALVIAITTWAAHNRELTQATPTPTLAPFPTPTTRIETLTYRFTKASDLDAFTQTGLGPMKVRNHQLVLQTGDNNQVGAQVTLDFAKGASVTFDHHFSTEYGYDYADFLIDGKYVLHNSGEGSATKVHRAISPGMHTIEWSYIKDGGTTGLTDQYDVDNIVFKKVRVTD